mgnify:CR=1 FL=1
MDKDNTKRVFPIAIVATVITGLVLLFELFIIFGLMENQLFLKSKIPVDHARKSLSFFG